MPREVVALVSADDVIAAVRVHVDRVHDLLRREGCGPAEAIEVCESYALALIDTLVNAPETVGDLAGWWFGRALELGRRLGGRRDSEGTAAEEVPTSVLSGTAGEAEVRAALDALPQQERAAVLLRDGYDLPVEAVGVALGRSPEGAAATIAAGRLGLVARHDGRPAPDLSFHTGRTAADIGMLGRLADGTLTHPRAVPLRRHLSTCLVCEETVNRQARARRLVAGLPVLAFPDEAREGLLSRVAERADAVLPSVDELFTAIEEDEDVRPLVSPIIVILAIVLALVMGIAVAAITTNGSSPGGFSAEPGAGPTEQPSFLPTVPTSGSPSVTTTPSRPPRRTASASTSASTSPTAVVHPSHTRAPGVATISVSPTQGRRGTQINVTGRGFAPNTTIQLSYSGALTSGTGTATSDGQGRFSGTLTARGTLPGNHTITASDGTHSASAPFTQTN